MESIGDVVASEESPDPTDQEMGEKPSPCDELNEEVGEVLAEGVNTDMEYVSPKASSIVQPNSTSAVSLPQDEQAKSENQSEAGETLSTDATNNPTEDINEKASISGDKDDGEDDNEDISEDIGHLLSKEDVCEIEDVLQKINEDPDEDVSQDNNEDGDDNISEDTGCLTSMEDVSKTEEVLCGEQERVGWMKIEGKKLAGEEVDVEMAELDTTVGDGQIDGENNDEGMEEKLEKEGVEDEQIVDDIGGVKMEEENLDKEENLSQTENLSQEKHFSQEENLGHEETLDNKNSSSEEMNKEVSGEFEVEDLGEQKMDVRISQVKDDDLDMVDDTAVGQDDGIDSEQEIAKSNLKEHDEESLDITSDDHEETPRETPTDVAMDVDESLDKDASSSSVNVDKTADNATGTHTVDSGSDDISKENSNHDSMPDDDDDDARSDLETKKETSSDDVASQHDASSKSPVSFGKASERKGKGASKGFCLGNIVSRLMIQVESKKEETDVPEARKDSGDGIVEKTQSKRSEQKQQGKQLRAATHAAMMMFQDGGEEEDEEDEPKAVSNPKPTDGSSKEMKMYATDTMDELLGLYGYNKVDSGEAEKLQLSSGFTQSRIPITGNNTLLKANQKQSQLTKAAEGGSGLVISNVTSMAPTDGSTQEGAKQKTDYCAECSLPVESTIMLKIGEHNFCSQQCVANYQSGQTKICDYCSGMITQAAMDKFVRDTQEGHKKFCSQTCTEEFSKRVRNCNTCGKEISKASEGILAPAGSDGKFVDFCQQECVDSYGKLPVSAVTRGNSKMEGGQPRYWAQDTFFICAICNNYAKAKHVISLQGKLNGLCSLECFGKFKDKNQLQFSLCSQCSALCSNQKMMRSIEIEGKLHRFCSMRCFKLKLKKSMNSIACAACKMPNLTQNMIEEWNGTELVRFFCSTVCLGKRNTIPFVYAGDKDTISLDEIQPSLAAKTTPIVTQKQQKPQYIQQSTATSGVRVTTGNKCDHCSKQQRPQYHLTMSDNSIRNFCTYGCVIAFQAQFNVPPVTLPQETLQLTCSQCQQAFGCKPLPLDFKGMVHVFCGQNCLDEFKRVNSVVVECDYCHLEKILHERIYFSGQARSFCSEGCKLLFKQQFAQRLGLRCTVCDYCAQTCRSRVERVYGNQKKKFCSMACKTHYDKWLNKGAKCDGCKCTGRKLTESFMWRGEMKRVCNQHCLLLFYTQQNIPNMNTQTQSTIPAIQLSQATTKTTPTPVITNVVSLAPGPNKPSQVQVTSSNNVQYVPKIIPVPKKCHKQTQITTAPPRASVPPPPPTPLPPAPKMVKNKITLVKPFTQTKSVSCKPLMLHKKTMTDNQPPLLIPVPVPIYVPVPMHMYTTPMPYPIALPVPIPVPMFIPVAHTSADRLLQSIEEIRQKIPSDPLEAELLMLADAIAGDGAKSTGQLARKPDDDLPNISSLQELEENADLDSNTLDSAGVLDPEFSTDNILKMAADLANVLKEDPCMDLKDDLDSLLAADDVQIDVQSRTTRSSKSGKTPTRRGRSRGSKRACIEEPAPSEQAPPEVKRTKEESRGSIGVNAYRYFTLQKKENPTGKEMKGLTLNPNLLEVTTEELAYMLCLMCREATQPDGRRYTPDILHLIFLSIQHHLSDSGRPENIFTDHFYGRFTDLLHEEIKEWMVERHPSTGAIANTTINEETLWNAKQLGAHSPYILLSTLIYFNAKHFQLKTMEHHKGLAFCRIQKHVRKMGTSRSMFLRYYPADRKKALIESTSKKRGRDVDADVIRHEQPENTENPLRCPVKLYEFYISKCPDSIRNNMELFYLVPERSCVPDSPVWYSSQQLGDRDMKKILTRILMVTDIHDFWEEMDEMADD